MIYEMHKAAYEAGNYLIERDPDVWETCEIEEDRMTGNLVIRFCGDDKSYDAMPFIGGEYKFIGPIYAEDIAK